MRRPETSYEFLTKRVHPWRRQLVFKGRRLTPADVVAEMRANGWSVEEVAGEHDIDPRAVIEAIDYVDRHGALIAFDAAEERRRLSTRMPDTLVPPRR